MGGWRCRLCLRAGGPELCEGRAIARGEERELARANEETSLGYGSNIHNHHMTSPHDNTRIEILECHEATENRMHTILR